jgi:spore coat-associated protein N
MNFRQALHLAAGGKGLTALIVGTAVIGGMAMVSSGVYAGLNAQAFNASPQSVTTDTLKLTMAPSAVSGLTGGVTTAIANVAPGDVVNRFLEIANTGTMTGSALKLAITDAASTALTSNGTAGLQVAIFECATQWTTSTGLCAGLPGTSVMSSTPASTLLTTPTAVTVTSLGSGVTSHLRLQITLPPGTETTLNGVLPVGTIQGLTSTITWTFSEVQRTATVTQG